MPRMSTSVSRRLALTLGEPAGIGPDLAVQLAGTPEGRDLVVVGDRRTLQERARLLQRPLELVEADFEGELPPAGLRCLDVPLAVPVRPGQPDARNGRALLHMLDAAIDGCVAGQFAGMVTAPLAKNVICDAGIPFSGHTEYLAERTGTARVVMMLAGERLRVALATTHLPLRDVAAAITPALLRDVLGILHADLVGKFGLPAPRILVAGLNPHAGEGGHLGREEIEIIEPVLHELRQQGMDLVGPLPADTLFQPWYLDGADAVLAMYHDQGLPVLKYATFGSGINITLGLPIIRTSVDHGTAYDKAGTGQAESGSLLAAVRLARHLARKKRT